MSATEIRIMAVMGILFAVMCYFMYLKWRYGRDAEHKVLALFRNKAGRWHFKLMEIVNGMVELEPPGEGKAGMTYTVDSESAPDIAYPINKMPFLQTTIPLVVFNEENWDPLSNISGRPVLPPALLYVMRHESWSAHGIRFAHEVERRADEAAAPKKKSSRFNMIVVIVVVVILVAAIVYGYNELTSLRAATGT